MKVRYVALIEGSKVPKEKITEGGGAWQDREHESGVALIVPDGVTVFDFDTPEDTEHALKIFNGEGLRPRVIRTARGIHAYFKTQDTLGAKTGVNLVCGLTADVKSWGKNQLVTVKIDGQVRPTLDGFDVPLEHLPEAPEWLYPVKQQTDKIIQKITKGNRNSYLFNRSFELQRQGYSKEEIITAIKIMNEYILDEPLPEKELMTSVLRPDSFQIEEDKASVPWFKAEQVGKRIVYKFLHDVLARVLVDEYTLVMGPGDQLYKYSNGYYQPLEFSSEFKAMVGQKYPQITKSEFNNVKLAVESMATLMSMAKGFDTTKVHDEYILNVKNGRLNLKTGELTPHSDMFFDMQQVPTNYVPNAKDEVLDQMIYNVFQGNQDVVDLFDEMIGYCFSKNISLGPAFFLVGAGANGKSTLINLLREMIGPENCCAVAPHDFEKRFTTITLHRKLVNLADDIGTQRIDQTGNYKKACTGDALQVEEKGQPMFVIKPYATPIFSANELPHFPNNTEADDRRRIIIPFKARFSPGMPGYDPDIGIKLRRPEVREALMARGVRGLHRVLENRAFTVSEEVIKATNEFKRDNSYTLQWIDFECIDEDFLIDKTPSEVYDHFKRWCANQDIRGKGLNRFAKELLEVFPGIESAPKREGKTVSRKYRRVNGK